MVVWTSIVKTCNSTCNKCLLLSSLCFYYLKRTRITDEKSINILNRLHDLRNLLEQGRRNFLGRDKTFEGVKGWTTYLHVMSVSRTYLRPAQGIT